MDQLRYLPQSYELGLNLRAEIEPRSEPIEEKKRQEKEKCQYFTNKLLKSTNQLEGKLKTKEDIQVGVHEGLTTENFGNISKTNRRQSMLS